MKRINPVQLSLLLVALAALFCLPIMGIAPNRILTPKGQYLLSHVSELPFQALLGLFLLLTLAVLAPLANRPFWNNFVVYLISAITIGYLCWLAGYHASAATEHSTRARCSFGAGFWSLLLLLWLMSMEACRAGVSSSWKRSGLAILLWLAPVWLMSLGHYQSLSLFIEYRANRDAFDNALQEHLMIVLTTLLLTISIGLWLGIRCYRHPAFGRVCLNLLSLLQTVPSIALFGLLLAPLSYLSQQWPWLAKLGISGIGTAPAVIALLLYSLLPMVRSTQTGLQQVSPLMLEAAAGMGMTRQQCLWQIHLRLALPVILSGLRVTTVQAIGLTMVAALIGAGGFGAIMFRGLSGSAIDLVLLGVIPVVVMAALTDLFFKLLVHLTETQQQQADASTSQGEVTL